MSSTAVPLPRSPGWIRPLGRSGLQVSAICAGGGVLGSVPQIFGYEVTADAASELLAALFESPISFLDTANGYSGGESERRIGAALRTRGGVPDDFVIATKVDGQAGDYSGQRVRASIAESADRLGMESFPLLHLHDPEYYPEVDFFAPGGAVEALVAAREEGCVQHLGIATGSIELAHRFLDTGQFEVLLMHSRYTLLDRSADELYDRAAAEGVGIVNAAVLGAGVLSRPQQDHSLYGYLPIEEGVLAAARRMEEAASAEGIPLSTLAIQFSLRDPRITSTAVGFSKQSRIEQTLTALNTDVPKQLWDCLEELVPPQEDWLH
ncbi:aldo/keto reductase [Brachybacterium sp. FME24]|uniref:aldo/keto reductase n=1 Tax=Brachybacterium sp. FME24 TaxID=2742605 RepID=UPI0018686769|nr:aldo/keto reductase [Brachybacterium sp. FME24]